MPSRELTSYRFQRSFYDAGKRLPERTRAQFYAGVLDYYFTGAEPNLPKAAADLFEGFRERVAMARTKALGASGDGHPGRLALDGGEAAGGYPVSGAEVAGEYPTSNQRIPNTRNDPSPWETSSEVLRLPPRVLRKEGGALREEEPSLGAVFLKDARSLPEFLDEVVEECERQEAFELMAGDAIERWAAGWIDRGWCDRNGRSLDELVDDGEGGGVERWRLMLRGLCEKAKGDSERGGGRWD